MRRILNVNFLIAILFVAVILLLNYINFVPLSKIPFLSFLPHATQTKINNQASTPTPTPLPPFTIKKIDIVNKSGEFSINNPTPQAGPLSLEKQILINGTYQVDNKKITIQASSQDSSIPAHPIPQGFTDSSAIPLRIEMIVDKTVYYQTDMPLTNSQNANVILFKIRLPFYSPVTIKIYSGSQEIHSQDLQL